MTTESKTEQEQSNLGVLTISRALVELWGKTESTLTTEELEWFAGFTEAAADSTAELSHIMQSLGCLIGSDDNNAGNFQNNKEIAELMFNLSSQLNTIHGMLCIGVSAEDRLRHPERYKAFKPRSVA